MITKHGYKTILEQVRILWTTDRVLELGPIL